MVEMGMHLVKIAEKLVEALSVGMAWRALEPKSPFSKRTCSIPGLLQNFRNRHILVQKVLPATATTDRRMAGMQPSHEYTPGWRTTVGTGVSLGELHAFGSQTVDIGGLDLFLPVTTQCTVTEIVSEDKDDVGGAR